MTCLLGWLPLASVSFWTVPWLVAHLSKLWEAVLYRPDEALGGGTQGPSAPVMGRELHSQSVPPFVFRNRLIKKQRHYFANKGPSSESYGFSSNHVWM